ncbi:MAG TPA: hypothetical protein PK537_06300 [Candidatus Limiplasma sp.]|nr:hypothetical protein [Candidatus Limiplasma sp.]
MKAITLRILALILCLVLPAAAMADTYLIEDTSTHVDFTLGVGLHADAFPKSEAHLADWESFLSRLTLSGSLNGQAFLQPQSRVYMEAALCIDGEEKIPFTYDGAHSYRYLITPMLMNDPVHFQMHNFFDFMLKPYYFTELPTQYIAMFLYPNATWFIADSFYTPVAEMIREAREDAPAEPDGDVYLDADNAQPVAAEENDGETVYVVPYERLYELCETLDYITTDDDGYYRVYCYFDALLAELYASYMVTDTLSSLEFVLDELDPDEEGMTVQETETGMVCTIGDIEVFTKSVSDGVTDISLQLPIPTDYWTTFTYRGIDTGDSISFTALASVTYEGDLAVSLSLEGEGLPVEGALTGESTVTAQMDGYVFEEVPAPLTLTCSWSRTAAELPYDLDLTVDWIHPQTGLPAFSVYFSGALSQVDNSVFTDVEYPQNDFFSLNDMYLQEYKSRWAPTIGLYMLPVVMEMPAGVIDDTLKFMIDKDILISILE